MKKNTLFLYVMICLVALLLNPQVSIGQNKKDSARAAVITALIIDQEYTFKASSVTPSGGRLRQLTSEYDLQISKEQVVAYLPYFGRAFSAPIGNSASGIQFTSKDFEYTLSEKKKAGWDVTIKFKDAQDTRQMQLSIFDNGSATLQVMSNNRQPINFNGNIVPPGKKK
ncbi:MAG: DUF4251 domain-containing protein [Chitinophagaceae bacterium]